MSTFLASLWLGALRAPPRARALQQVRPHARHCSAALRGLSGAQPSALPNQDMEVAPPRRYTTSRFGAPRGADDEGGSLRRGDAVLVRVVGFGPLGASVVIERPNAGPPLQDASLVLPKMRSEGDAERGLILQSELRYLREARRGDGAVVGEQLPAFVQNVREDGKLDICLRSPSKEGKLQDARQMILDALADCDGVLPIGDKSSPQRIADFVPGLSKAIFKNAVGALFRERQVLPSPDEIQWHPERGTFDAASAPPVPKRAPTSRGAERGYTPVARPTAPRASTEGPADKGAARRKPPVAALFVANLPYDLEWREVVTEVARACGVESAMITGGALRRDRKDGGASGCAHLEFRSVVAAKMVADRISEGASVRGRSLRAEPASRAYEPPRDRKKTDTRTTDDAPAAPRGESPSPTVDAY